MDGWVDGWMDGWIDGWLVGWVVGWMDEWWVGGWMDANLPVRVWGGTSGTRKVFTHFLLKMSPFVQLFSGGCLPVRH